MTTRVFLILAWFASSAMIVWGGWYMSQPISNSHARGIRIGTGVQAIIIGALNLAQLVFTQWRMSQ